MSDRAAVRDLAVEFEETVGPVLFADVTPSDSPALTFLAGQPGSGRARAVGRVLANDANAAVLNADDLRALAGVGDAAVEGREDPGAAWVTAGIRYARETRRSLVLDGPLTNPSVVSALASRFEDAGYRTRVLLVAARRAESLLSVVSGALDAHRARRGLGAIDLVSHDLGVTGTTAVAVELDASAPVGRVTVLDRAGDVVFDRSRDGSDRSFAGASGALHAAQSRPLSVLQAVQWLSELRRVSEYTESLRQPPPDVVEALIELHELALNEIVPELPIPHRSRMAAAQERQHASHLVTLRQLVPQPPLPPRPDAPGPVASPTGPERGGVSR